MRGAWALGIAAGVLGSGITYMAFAPRDAEPPEASSTALKVITDNETGCQYLHVSGALTPRIGVDGAFMGCGMQRAPSPARFPNTSWDRRL